MSDTPAPKRAAFSLVEVVVALGVFAVAIISVVGLLAPSLQNVTQVSDSDVAARLVGEIEAELARAGYTQVDSALPRANLARRLYLVANRAGDRLLLTGHNRADPDAATLPFPSPANANPPNAAVAPGLAYRDRYFLVELKLEPDNSKWPVAPASYLPIHVKVLWPWRLPNGPEQNPAVLDDGSSERLDDPANPDDDIERRSYSDFFFVLPR